MEPDELVVDVTTKNGVTRTGVIHKVDDGVLHWSVWLKGREPDTAAGERATPASTPVSEITDLVLTDRT